MNKYYCENVDCKGSPKGKYKEFQVLLKPEDKNPLKDYDEGESWCKNCIKRDIDMINKDIVL